MAEPIRSPFKDCQQSAHRQTAPLPQPQSHSQFHSCSIYICIDIQFIYIYLVLFQYIDIFVCVKIKCWHAPKICERWAWHLHCVQKKRKGQGIRIRTSPLECQIAFGTTTVPIIGISQSGDKWQLATGLWMGICCRCSWLILCWILLFLRGSIFITRV